MMNSSLLMIARSVRRPGTIGASLSTYAQEKLAAKELRRQRWGEQQERLERVKVRRVGRVPVKKTEFQEWYDKRRTYHEIMDRKARQGGLEWKYQVAAVVERLPVVTPDLEDWERDYVVLRKHLDQFSWDYPEELGLEKKEYGDDDDDEEKEAPPPRETEADASGNISTLDRRLKTRVFYSQKDTEGSLWGFPTVDLEGDETLKAAAMRLAKERLGDDAEVLAFSNCPIAVDLEVDKKDGFYGTKTFFMKLQYQKGTTKEVTDVANYGWLDRTELAERAHAAEGPNAAKFYRYML